ncbi:MULTISPECIES: hypothetical protein [Neptunomonas]|uniref:Uncharacterized protein n=1 Tax=Neptunomonas marina TaxID=1815562 RepID=A0A437QDS0_9GAMM|nr:MULTISPECIES: hypothetical protein [Neptunomonas]RVU32697.1 hypothetical protein EOE65_03315 [Neptunomonas marina]
MVNRKDQIDDLIGILVSYYLSPSLSAGWHAPSQLEWFQQITNKRPPSITRQKQLTAAFASADEHQSNDKADDKMISEARFLRREHHNYGKARAMFRNVEDKYAAAVLARAYHQAIYKRVFSNKELADRLEVSVRSYTHNRNVGYDRLAYNLEIIEGFVQEAG